jgi:hypothetical protein
MRKFIKRARKLGVQFDYETSIRMACLFDVGEAILVERARLEEYGLPTLVHDDLIKKIEDEIRTEAVNYKQEAMTSERKSS